MRRRRGRREGVYREAEFADALRDVAAREKEHMLERFRREYERLFKRYVKSGQNDGRLVIQLRKLKKEIQSKAQQNSRYVDELTEHKSELSRLQQEELQVTEDLSLTESRSSRLQRQFTRLDGELDSLQTRLLAGVGIGRDAERRIQDLGRKRAELERSVFTHETALQKTLDQRQALQTQVDDLELERKSRVAQIRTQGNEIRSLNSTISQYGADSSSVQETIRGLQEGMQVSRGENAGLSAQLALLRQEESELAAEQEDRLRRIKDALVNAILAKTKFERVKKELKMRLGENSLLEVQKQEMAAEVEAFEEERERFSTEIEAVTEEKTHLETELEEVNEEIQLEFGRKKLLQDSLGSEKTEMIQLQQRIELGKVGLDNVRNQRKLLRGKTARIARETDSIRTKVQVSEGEKRNLDIEIREFRVASNHVFEENVSIQRDIRRHKKEAREAETKARLAQEKLIVVEEVNSKLRAEIESEQARAKDLTNLISVVTKDRNSMRRDFQTLCNNATSSQSKFRHHQRSIDVSKKELRQLDVKLVDENEDICTGRTQLDTLRTTVENLRETINTNRARQKSAYREVLRLKAMIGSTEREQNRQTKELTSVTNDRDVLGSQLVKRTQEVASLVKEINHQRSMLHTGHVTLQSQEDEIILLQAKLDQSTNKLGTLRTRMEEHSNLKTEVNALRNQLLTENRRVAALLQEKDVRLHVHPWRVGDENTEFHELVVRKRELQREIEAKRQELMKRDLELKEREALYIELKNVVKKQPGEEDVQLRRVLRDTLRRKKKQRRALEDRIHRSQDELKRAEVQSLQVDMDIENVKKQWTNVQ